MPDYIKCPKCNKPIREGIPFCPHCGERQVDNRVKDEFGKDPYSILQVTNRAEPEVIEAAYKGLAKKYHPDKDSSPEAQEKMKELNWAYKILSNAERREEYDRVKRKETRQQSEEYKPKHEEKSRPSPPPQKQKPSPTTKYKKQDNQTNWLGRIFVAILIIPIMVFCILLILGSTDNSTGSKANSENVAISDNKKSPTKKATKIPTKKAIKIPTNTPHLGLEYFTLNISDVGSDEIVKTYKAIEYQFVDLHIGERLAVCGMVTSVYQGVLFEPTYIEFGSKFAAIISKSNLADFEYILEYLKGEDICVYGSIYKENNKIYLELTDSLHIFGNFWGKVDLNPKRNPSPGYAEPRDPTPPDYYPPDYYPPDSFWKDDSDLDL